MLFSKRAFASIATLVFLAAPYGSAYANSSEGFLANINNSIAKDYRLDVVLSPTVNKGFVKKVRSNILRAIDATDEVASIEGFSVYLFTVKDAVWLKETLAKYKIEEYMPAVSTKQYLRSGDRKDCGQAFTAKINGSSAFFQCTPYDGSGGDSSTHEVFHMFQDSLGHFSSEGSETPLWLSEGSAVYFQDLLTTSSLSRQIKYIPFSKKSLIKNLTKLEATFDPQGVILNRNYGYVVGSNAVKTLIRKYGYQKFVLFNAAIKDAGSWQEAFISTYKKTPKKFYTEVASALSEIYN
jgi:hypothetical protein